MNRLRIIKIALLIVILAEEIRNAMYAVKIRKFTPEDSKGFPDITKDSIKEPK
ncbi:hypothetical protein HBQ69_10145 [Staphylococcus aureus]|nr:hypothetical protein [Staphylococcus aureus]